MRASAPTTPRQPTAIRYWQRGTGYTVSSALALLAGYLISGGILDLGGGLIVATYVLVSFPFFVAYAIGYHYQSAAVIPTGTILTGIQRDATVLATMFVAPAAALCFVLAWVFGQPPVEQNDLAALLIYTVLFWGYAYFLRAKESREAEHRIRHQLVWPVSLGIAVAFFYGLYLNSFASDLSSLSAVGLLVVVFILSEVFLRSKVGFLSVGSALLLAGTILVGLPILSTPPLRSLLFALSVAAYLAVFESWRITAHYSLQDASMQPLPPTAESNYATVANPPAAQSWYMASFAALVLSVLLLPIWYIGSEYGLLFIVFLDIHAFLAFVYWYNIGSNLPALTDAGRVVWWRRSFGFLFLAVLVVDARWGHLNEELLLPSFMSLDGWSWFALVAALVIGAPNLRSLLRLFSRRRRLPVTRDRLTSALAFGCLGGSSVVLIAAEDRLAGKQEIRAEHAWLSYVACVIFVILFQTIRFLLGQPRVRDSISIAIGAISTVRIVTSLFIGLSAFVPIWIGSGDMLNAAVVAVPYVLIACGGFALNDIFDISKDRRNHPSRALPAQRTTTRAVVIIALFMFASAAILALATNTGGLLFPIFVLIGVCGYNFVVTRAPSIKTAFAAFLSVVPMTHAAFVLDWPAQSLALISASFLFLLGRELLMDILDAPGDSAAQRQTLALRIGASRASRIATCAQIAGVLLLVAVVFQLKTSWVAVVVSFIVVAASATWLMWWYAPRNRRPLLIKAQWIPILLGLSLIGV